jgi:hypothetical protein
MQTLSWPANCNFSFWRKTFLMELVGRITKSVNLLLLQTIRPAFGSASSHNKLSEPFSITSLWLLWGKKDGSYESKFSTIKYDLKFSGRCMKMAVFWVVAPRRLVWVYQPFRGLYCFHQQGHHRPDDGGSKDLWNVGKLTPVDTVLQPRRQPCFHYYIIERYLSWQ